MWIFWRQVNTLAFTNVYDAHCLHRVACLRSKHTYKKLKNNTAGIICEDNRRHLFSHGTQSVMYSFKFECLESLDTCAFTCFLDFPDLLRIYLMIKILRTKTCADSIFRSSNNAYNRQKCQNWGVTLKTYYRILCLASRTFASTLWIPIWKVKEYLGKLLFFWFPSDAPVHFQVFESRNCFLDIFLGARVFISYLDFQEIMILRRSRASVGMHPRKPNTSCQTEPYEAVKIVYI